MLWKSRAKPRFWAFNDRIRSLLCDRANPLKFAEVAYETSASDRGNPPVGAGRLRFLSTLWHWAFRILVLRLSSLWLLRSEEHTSELPSLMRISYAVFCLQKTTNNIQ